CETVDFCNSLIKYISSTGRCLFTFILYSSFCDMLVEWVVL
ncbi:hypothetical protein HMPREF1869_00995, partial [Bacteroidales bacterium KA00251]